MCLPSTIIFRWKMPFGKTLRYAEQESNALNLNIFKNHVVNKYSYMNVQRTILVSCNFFRRSFLQIVSLWQISCLNTAVFKECDVVFYFYFYFSILFKERMKKLKRLFQKMVWFVLKIFNVFFSDWFRRQRGGGGGGQTCLQK